MRIYVLSTALTSAPGKVGTDGKYLYDVSPVIVPQGNYDGNQEILTNDPDTGGGTQPTVITPQLCTGEKAVFFKKPSGWGDNVNIYVYDDSSGSNVTISNAWPGNAMTNLGNSNYKYIFNSNFSTNWKILFNSNGQQTPAGSQPGWNAVNGAVYQQSSTASGAISAILPETPCGVLAANETTNAELILYPNPVKNILSVSNLGNSGEKIMIDIYSANGSLVKNITAKRENALQINVSNLPTGIYLLKINYKTYKFIKE